jgi:hypothetical protein
MNRGDPGETRTLDLAIRNRSLFPAELRGRVVGAVYPSGWRTPKLAVLAGWPLIGGAEAPLAETRKELSTEQERNHPAAKQKHEFDGFGGHRRESPYQRGGGRNIARRRVFPKIRWPSCTGQKLTAITRTVPP